CPIVLRLLSRPRRLYQLFLAVLRAQVVDRAPAAAANKSDCSVDSLVDGAAVRRVVVRLADHATAAATVRGSWRKCATYLAGIPARAVRIRFVQARAPVPA